MQKLEVGFWVGIPQLANRHQTLFEGVVAGSYLRRVRTLVSLNVKTQGPSRSKKEAVIRPCSRVLWLPRRARIQGSQTRVSLNLRLKDLLGVKKKKKRGSSRLHVSVAVSSARMPRDVGSLVWPFVGASQGRSWSHSVVLGAILGQLFSKVDQTS